ncbi:MAG TPA: MBL fold metallo-hydrolase [Bryobacteraceae bacterium]|nr:MBL fold metallo-hydrolase [Bryobacteraceae bacterium]
MDVRFGDKGIHVADIDLWLDPQDCCQTAWLSHAHSDHARGLHGHVFATPETLRIYRLRWPEDEAVPQLLQPMQWGEPVQFRGASLTAFPASHILGAAQLLIEFSGERLVYTGDIKLRPPMCGETTVVVPCDRLIIESTFGLPIFSFLDRDTACRRIIEFTRECLADGTTPVFVGYPLGRGQEIVHTLCQAGIAPSVHGAIGRLIPAYEEAGFSFPGWRPYAARDPEAKALVVVPGFRNYLEASGRNYRLAYVSGWAALDNARSRAGAEVLIPYSDHADYEELLAIVERSGAREVDVVHGYTEPFAGVLRERGIDARAPRAAAARAAEEAQES